jgi:hypothetical protein
MHGKHSFSTCFAVFAKQILACTLRSFIEQGNKQNCIDRTHFYNFYNVNIHSKGLCFEKKNNCSFGISIKNWPTFFRMTNFTAREPCLDECSHVEYIADVSTTKLSAAVLSDIGSLGDSFVTFSMYYRTFDVTRIAYHGKVTIF